MPLMFEVAIPDELEQIASRLLRSELLLTFLGEVSLHQKFQRYFAVALL